MILIYLFLFCNSLVIGQNTIFDNLWINSSTISVSGFSSGACFATQFHVAFSKSVRLSLYGELAVNRDKTWIYKKIGFNFHHSILCLKDLLQNFKGGYSGFNHT